MAFGLRSTLPRSRARIVNWFDTLLMWALCYRCVSGKAIRPLRTHSGPSSFRTAAIQLRHSGRCLSLPSHQQASVIRRRGRAQRHVAAGTEHTAWSASTPEPTHQRHAALIIGPPKLRSSTDFPGFAFQSR